MHNHASIQKWKETVDDATRAQKGSAPMIVDAKAALQRNDIAKYVALLEEAYRRDMDNPQVALNLGLAYQRVARYRDAAYLLTNVLERVPEELVAVTAANAAFSEAREGRPKEAVALLSVVATRVLFGNTMGAVVDLKALPGIATWADMESILQSRPGDAAPIITQAVTAVGGAQAVPPQVADLAEFYEAVAAM